MSPSRTVGSTLSRRLPAEHRWALIAVAFAAAIALVDIATPFEPVVLGLLVVPPLVAAATVRPSTTGWIAALCLIESLALGVHAGIWLSADHVIHMVAVLAAGVLAVGLAMERRDTERSLGAIYRISQAAHRAASLQDLFKAIHDIVGELMPARNFYIALCDAESERISFPYFVDEFDAAPAPKPLGRGLTEYVLRSGEPLLVTPRVQAELERRGDVELIGAPSIDWLGVPLQVEGKTIGVLVVQSYTERVRYSERQKHVLQFVSTQVAMAIERKRAEEALRRSEARLAQAQEMAHLGSWELDLTDAAVNRNVLWWSDETYRIFGYEPGQVAVSNDLFFGHVPKEDRPRIEAAVAQALRERGRYFIEHRVTHRDGTERVVQEQATVVSDGERPLRMLGTVLDVTDQRQLEDQLRQAQKMEAVGQLAGGIAHDFNNLLTTVLTMCQMLQSELPEDATAQADLEAIRGAAQHGSELTKKLLAFSRRQRLQFKSVAVTPLVEQFTRMARRMVPEDVEVAVQVSEPAVTVTADPAALEQILMNLVTNARDAMPGGGKLAIRVESARLEADDRRVPAQTAAGQYAVLSVSDSGAGMDVETQRRMFEPFFTTKPVGQGTGLGMPMVYGLVKEHGGFVEVASLVGEGTTVRVYLPAAPDAPAGSGTHVPELRGGSETILLVEDDEALRRAGKRVLNKFGYTVITAGDGIEALRVMQTRQTPPDLIVSDVVMPNASGPQFLQALRDTGLSPRILFTSGYPARDVNKRTPLEPSVPFLAKPWTISELVRCVREVLDAPEEPTHAT